MRPEDITMTSAPRPKLTTEGRHSPIITEILLQKGILERLDKIIERLEGAPIEQHEKVDKHEPFSESMPMSSFFRLAPEILHHNGQEITDKLNTIEQLLFSTEPSGRVTARAKLEDMFRADSDKPIHSGHTQEF